jgi:hypothetical protein
VAKALATQKHKDNVQALEGDLTKSEANVLALTAQVTGLSKDLHAARSVGLLRRPLLDFEKLVLLLCFPLLFQEQREEAEASLKAKLILETSAQDLRKALKKIEKQKTMYSKLRADYECLSQEVQDVQEAEKEEVGWQIKDLEAKGKPVKENFIGHSRTLMATGASARAVREQLYLNAAYFLTKEGYAEFEAQMPSIRWFQLQREGLGYESLVYSFIRVAKCEEVVMWGFDETSLNGIPTLNQWCRIKEGHEYVQVTIECAGLMVGSTAMKVAEHVRVTWERGQSVLAMLRDALGEEADNLVPLVNGGVTLTKLRGVMHDTCNTANLVATKVRVLRDDAGKSMFGAEEWRAMEEAGKGWQDFLCGNHTRNLHFDAFNRLFSGYVKDTLGEGMAACKVTPCPNPNPCPTLTLTPTPRQKPGVDCVLNQMGSLS